MLSSLKKLAIGQLSTEDPPSSKNCETLYPTLSFPPAPPAGSGTNSLCSRCLTLLSHVIIQYGDGTGYKDLEFLHSSELSDPLGPGLNDASNKATTNQRSSSHDARAPLSCVLCAKSLCLFDAVRAHVAFESSLRNTSYKEWSLLWRIDAPNPKIYPQFAFPHDSVSVLMTVEHQSGYGWGIGGFKMYPDWSVTGTGDVEHKANHGDYPVIVALDPKDEGSATADLDPQFHSTLSPESLALVSSWIQDCARTHSKCQTIFGADAVWFPDRLIHITRTKSTESTKSGHPTAKLFARIVLKSDLSDFPSSSTTRGLTYLSLSHCWGPPPDPCAPLGGRMGSILTKSNLSAWQKELLLDDLPLAFRHAIMTCASLQCEYMWIDSLCILQDDLGDWQVQSAVMGNIYKFATLNIAALASVSDYEGFINERDTRVEFGFRTSFASILNRGCEERNESGQNCVLLRGSAKLLWNFSHDLPASSASNAPLFERAWVYQERCLARRMLAFSKNSVSWACDEADCGERPDWAAGGLEFTGLRDLLHTVTETTARLTASIADKEAASPPRRLRPEEVRAFYSRFDMRWHSCVTNYTLCKLTKHTDKLIAISAVARELDRTQIIRKRYLAGLWDVNMPFQLAWITVHGKETPPRRRAGSVGYVAPSWSWASIEAPVQPRFIFNFGNEVIALADVHAADVALETDNPFGSVKAGWLRVCGRLNRVRAANSKAGRGHDKVDSLKDVATGEELWFCSDTVEGYGLVESNVDKVVWTPLTLRLSNNMVECTALVLFEDETGSGDAFVRADEKVYRRIGSGNFGRIPNMLQQDKLLLGLGVFPDAQMQKEQGNVTANGFKRNEDGLEEFVLI